jgi:alpha-L-fucosidase
MPYEPTWTSIDSRPIPAWFPKAKFGIFIHWGVYSVPAWGKKGSYAEWYWHELVTKDEDTRRFHNAQYGADFKYPDFAPLFKAELFDPARWADVFARSGARYVVLTSKHHEGFCLWPNAQAWNWNSVDIGPHRDLCGELRAAVLERGLRMGYYYSLYEWFHPHYLNDVPRYVGQHMLPQLKDLVARYEPSYLYTDGEWDLPSEQWRSVEFLAWLFNESPVRDEIVVNDRWGKECRSVHGGVYSTEYGEVGFGGTLSKDRMFEEIRGLGASFGYNRNESAEDYLPAQALVHLLVDTVARGGNLMLDVGPTADGRIPEIQEERLLQIGEWLGINGEAIFETEPWGPGTQDEHVRYTRRGDTLYAICLEWPQGDLVLSAPRLRDDARVTLLGFDASLKWRDESGTLRIQMPPVGPTTLKAPHAFTFRLDGLA